MMTTAAGNRLPVLVRCLLLLASLAAMPTLAHADPAASPPDNAAWARLLDRYVTAGADGINRVDYAALAASKADRAALDAYVDALAGTQVSALSADDRFALWTNLYNALTVQVVVDHYPVASIRDIAISPGLFAKGPWGKKLVTVEGRAMSLDDIEHETLRKAWDEPRVHFAVNCASLGCPNLRREPYEGATLDAQLAEAARDFISHPRGARFEGKALHLSSIFDWYGRDFGAARTERLAAIAQYADGKTADRIATHEGPIRYDYDWSLNDVRGAGE